MSDPVLRERLRSFLEEDLAFGDLTTELVVEPHTVNAEVVSRQKGIVAGMVEASELLEMCGIRVLESNEDGSSIGPGEVLMRMTGVNRSILMVERTLLNMVSRMSGIATATSLFLETARRGNPKVRIAATRKTAPGLRWLDKKAVVLGGGYPHRMALHDSILIKDNHVAAVGDLATCVRRARSRASFTKKVEVEVSSVEDVIAAARAGADVVMLDNMSFEEMKRAIRALDSEGLRSKVMVEASGNISLENVAEVASSGVDVISVGSLTHSVRSLDLSLQFAE